MQLTNASSDEKTPNRPASDPMMIRMIFIALPALLAPPPFRRPHLGAEAVGARLSDVSHFRIHSGLAGRPG